MCPAAKVDSCEVVDLRLDELVKEDLLLAVAHFVAKLVRTIDPFLGVVHVLLVDDLAFLVERVRYRTAVVVLVGLSLSKRLARFLEHHVRVESIAYEALERVDERVAVRVLIENRSPLALLHELDELFVLDSVLVLEKFLILFIVVVESVQIFGQFLGAFREICYQNSRVVVRKNFAYLGRAVNYRN